MISTNASKSSCSMARMSTPLAITMYVSSLSTLSLPALFSAGADPHVTMDEAMTPHQLAKAGDWVRGMGWICF
ncbi:hypothetical protein BDV12DRAFT_177019 [Aspergillus spectabilis]